MVRRFLSTATSGVTSIEYALIAAVTATAAVAIGPALFKLFSSSFPLIGTTLSTTGH